MRQWIVRGGGPSPRFRNPEGKKWWDGDIITEQDVLGIYRADQIEVLIESGALELEPEPGAEPEPAAGAAASDTNPKSRPRNSKDRVQQ